MTDTLVFACLEPYTNPDVLIDKAAIALSLFSEKEPEVQRTVTPKLTYVLSGRTQL